MKANPRPPSKLTYIALLRGINVGGRATVKMDQLRQAFEALSHRDVRTYIQSGNVIFSAAAQATENLAAKIEEKLVRQFSMEIPVIVRTAAELSESIKKNPFPTEADLDPSKVFVIFLARTPEKAALKKLDAIPAGSDKFHSSGKDVYVYCAGYAETKLSSNAMEKALAVRATARNWRTVTKLYEMTLG
jgi:uncharacterized protein (DUF1697 family)